MHGRLRVHLLPQEVPSSDLAGSAVVVIDLLRASSTICQALASGATEVVPFLEIDDVLAAVAKAGDRTSIVLGGERSGGKIPGFDLGNSPAEYTPEAVFGRRVFITTTNGTRALDHARLADRIVVGAIVNLSAVATSLKEHPQIDILCAGTGLERTREDILAAGAFVEQLIRNNVTLEPDDTATSAHSQWIQVKNAAKESGRSLSEQFALELRNTQGGQNLIGIGLDQDLVDCAQIDRHKIVPGLDVTNWRITAR